MRKRIIVEGMDRDRTLGRMYLGLERDIPDDVGVLRTVFPVYRLALLGRMTQGTLVLAESHGGLEIEVDTLAFHSFESTQTVIVEDGRVYHGWLREDGSFVFDKRMHQPRFDETLKDIYGTGKGCAGGFDNAYRQIVENPEKYRPF